SRDPVLGLRCLVALAHDLPGQAAAAREEGSGRTRLDARPLLREGFRLRDRQSRGARRWRAARIAPRKGGAGMVGRPQELTCRELVDVLADSFAGELDAEERSNFEGHLATCRDCVIYLRSYAMVMRLVQVAYADDRAPAAMPGALVQAVLAARRRRQG